MAEDLDALLVAAKSDPQARGALARALYFTVRGYITMTLRVPRVAAEDLTQSTLAVLLAKIDAFEPRHPRAFRAYVLKTAELQVKQHQRSWAREATRRVDLGSSWLARDPGPAMSSDLALRDLLARVGDVLAEFGSTTRRTIEGWMQGEDWRVLAEREGVKGPTLRSRAHRALARLRERLRRRMPDLMPESSST